MAVTRGQRRAEAGARGSQQGMEMAGLWRQEGGRGGGPWRRVQEAGEGAGGGGSESRRRGRGDGEGSEANG